MNPLDQNSVEKEIDCLSCASGGDSFCCPSNHEYEKELTQAFLRADLRGAVHIQLPIKTQSERIPGKNFRIYRGRPLFAHMLETLIKLEPLLRAAGFDPTITVALDSVEAYDAVVKELRVIRRSIGLEATIVKVTLDMRPRWLSENWANGNHLLWERAVQVRRSRAESSTPTFYIQAFATAPLVMPSTILDALATLLNSHGFDSLVPGTAVTGFYWFQGEPVNYDPTKTAGLRRSQDIPMWKESTGFYIIREEALLETGCRIGRHPIFFNIPADEAKDIDWERDLHD